MSVTIGLTGGIASGKSTITEMFVSLSIPIIDADKIAREVVEPGQPSYKEIVRTFGETIVKADQSINRKKLGSIIFSNKEKRLALNKIVHPAVRKSMIGKRDALISEGSEIIVMDIPLLFESELTHLVDQTLVIYVDEAVQMKRLMERDKYTFEEAKQRINSQLSLEKKKELADYVIDNNGSKENSREQLLEILKTIDAKR